MTENVNLEKRFQQMRKKQIIEMNDREHGLRGLGDITYTYTYKDKCHRLDIDVLLLNERLTYEGEEAKKYYYFLLRDGDKEKIDLVKRLAADSIGIPVIRLKEKSRKKEVVWARNMVMWYVNKQMRYTQEDTGAIFKKDHASVIHAVKRFDTDYKYLDAYQSISKKTFIRKCSEHKLFSE